MIDGRKLTDGLFGTLWKIAGIGALIGIVLGLALWGLWSWLT